MATKHSLTLLLQQIRMQDELEKLNAATNSINHLEAELDVSYTSVTYYAMKYSISCFVVLHRKQEQFSGKR